MAVPQAGDQISHYRLRQLFGITTLVAIYAVAVHLSIQYGTFGAIGVSFLSAAIGTILCRRWLHSTNVYAIDLLGGAVGGILGTSVSTLFTMIYWSSVSSQSLTFEDTVGGVLRIGVMLGGLLGSMFGILVVIVVSELDRIGRTFASRRAP